MLILRTFDSFKCDHRIPKKKISFRLFTKHLPKRSIDNMYHTNASYRHDAEVASLGDGSPSKHSISSPERVPQIHDSSIHSAENSPQITADRQIETINSVEPVIPNEVKEEANGGGGGGDEDEYYSLKRLQEIRRGKRDEDSGLSRRVRRFYKKQDELIDIYERVNIARRGSDDPNVIADKLAHEKTQRLSNILTKVSLAVNMV